MADVGTHGGPQPSPGVGKGLRGPHRKEQDAQTNSGGARSVTSQARVRHSQNRAEVAVVEVHHMPTLRTGKKGAMSICNMCFQDKALALYGATELGVCRGCQMLVEKVRGFLKTKGFYVVPGEGLRGTPLAPPAGQEMAADTIDGVPGGVTPVKAPSKRR